MFMTSCGLFSKAKTIAALARMTVQDSRKLLGPQHYPSWVVFAQQQKLSSFHIFLFCTQCFTFHIENVTHACCTIVRDLELITASLRHERGCCLFVPSSAASKAQLQCQKLSILEVRTADELLHIDYSYGHNEYF